MPINEVPKWVQMFLVSTTTLPSSNAAQPDRGAHACCRLPASPGWMLESAAAFILFSVQAVVKWRRQPVLSEAR